MLTPATVAQTAYIGGTWERTIQLWEDTEHTKPFKLEGWTVKFVVEGQAKGKTLVTLESGKGLTITEAEGKVEAVMTPAQTAEVEPEKTRYYLSITKGGVTWFPLDGPITYAKP